MTEDECRAFIMNLAASRSYPIKPHVVDTYVEHLKDLPSRRMARGVLFLIREYEGQYFPSVAEIRRACTALRDEVSDQATENRYLLWVRSEDYKWSCFLYDQYRIMSDEEYMTFVIAGNRHASAELKTIRKAIIQKWRDMFDRQQQRQLGNGQMASPSA